MNCLVTCTCLNGRYFDASKREVINPGPVSAGHAARWGQGPGEQQLLHCGRAVPLVVLWENAITFLSVSKDQNTNNSCFTRARTFSQTREAMLTVFPARSLQTSPSVIQPGLVGWHFEGSPHPSQGKLGSALRTAAGPPLDPVPYLTSRKFI